jgi:hypothetical protein
MSELHSGVPPEKKGKKFISISVRNNISRYSPRVGLTSIVYFYVRASKSLAHAVLIENKQTVCQRMFMRIKLTATIRELLEGRYSSECASTHCLGGEYYEHFW